ADEGGEPLGRFIPTRVGRGPASASPSTCSPVHPHSRGERQAVYERGELVAGSSPLAWGEALAGGPAQTVARFIPTRVGRGSARRSRPGRPAVHPHSRGERTTTLSWNSPGLGSSPLAWGEGGMVGTACSC